MIPTFDPLDPSLRYCVYCEADCWPEPENQQHAESCPFVTGIYPVRDLGPDGTYGQCTACTAQFLEGEYYVLVSDTTGRQVVRAGSGETCWVACLGCGLTERDPRTETT